MMTGVRMMEEMKIKYDVVKMSVLMSGQGRKEERRSSHGTLMTRTV